MTETKSNNGLKVIAGLLGVVLLATIIYTVSLYQDKKKTTMALTQEKDLVVAMENKNKRLNKDNERLNEELDNLLKFKNSSKDLEMQISILNSKYQKVFLNGLR